MRINENLRLKVNAFMTDEHKLKSNLMKGLSCCYHAKLFFFYNYNLNKLRFQRCDFLSELILLLSLFCSKVLYETRVATGKCD